MGLLLQSDVFRGLSFRDRLVCRYADGKLRQRELWLGCSTRLKSASTSRPWRRVNCTLENDELDPPLDRPHYHTYIDPISGEVGPAFSPNRSNLPDRPFWSEDMTAIVRRAKATVPTKSTSQPSGGTPGSRRRKTSKASTKQDAKTTQRSVQVVELEEEEDEDEYRDEFVTYKDPDEKEPEEEPAKDLVPLSNEKLWYNWRKIPPEDEPWHEFSRPPTDCFAVMATAAAKSGQIKLFGDKPTVAETALARARKDALKQERLDMETKRREEIGGLAYYSEWVKAWKEDTSKEAVQRNFEETGEDESVQLMKMFQHQTFAEYRIMMGTDPRIQRDPLCIRMTMEEKKAVWGGDPIYPSVNYYQDPNAKADYRGPNFHEPSENIFDTLRKAGRLMSKEKLKQIHDQEAASQYAMEKDIEDAIAGAVDIGEKEEEEEGEEAEEGKEKEDGEEDEGEEQGEVEEDGKVEGTGEEDERDQDELDKQNNSTSTT